MTMRALPCARRTPTAQSTLAAATAPFALTATRVDKESSDSLGRASATTRADPSGPGRRGKRARSALTSAWRVALVTVGDETSVSFSDFGLGL